MIRDQKRARSLANCRKYQTKSIKQNLFFSGESCHLDLSLDVSRPLLRPPRGLHPLYLPKVFCDFFSRQRDRESATLTLLGCIRSRPHHLLPGAALLRCKRRRRHGSQGREPIRPVLSRCIIRRPPGPQIPWPDSLRRRRRGKRPIDPSFPVFQVLDPRRSLTLREGLLLRGGRPLTGRPAVSIARGSHHSDTIGSAGQGEVGGSYGAETGAVADGEG